LSHDDVQLEELDPATLRSEVRDAVRAPAEREPALLPFDRRSWEDFERIVLLIAEQIHGLRTPRLYGVRGQNQHGIDLYGTDPSGRTIAYQVKNLQSFEVGDLNAAVERFATGHRPVDAESLIVAVACTTNRTEISEQLERLRAMHTFPIELFDQTALSEHLRTRPDLVRRVFGDAWAEVFCAGAPWDVPTRSETDRIAEALVRGPIQGLGLTADLDQAQKLASEDPAQAAGRLGMIIDRLAREGFGGVTGALRAQRADLLLFSGAINDGADELLRQAWNGSNEHAGDLDKTALSRLRALVQEHGLDAHRHAVNAMEEVERWHSAPWPKLDRLVDLCEQLVQTLPDFGDEVLLWTMETLVASRMDEPTARLETLATPVLARRSARGPNDELSVRVRVALADLGGDRTALLREARAGQLGPRMATIVHARQGRWCTLTNQDEEGESEYLQAVQRAVAAHLGNEAADALRNITRLRIWFGQATDDLNTLPRLAATVENNSTPRGLFRGRDPYDAGNEHLVKRKLPSALRRFRAALRQAAIRGDYEAELAARNAIATVLARSGETTAAIWNAMKAGATGTLDECGTIERYLDVRQLCTEGPHWERAAALHVATAEADLIPDEDVERYVEIALAGISESQRSWFGPHVHVQAWHLLAALADRLPEGPACALLDVLQPMIPRAAGTYSHTDDDHTKIVAKIAATHATLLDRACDHIAAIIDQGDNFADTMRSRLQAHLPALPPRLLEHLVRLADNSSRPAAEALADIGTAHPTMVAAAAEAAERVLSEPPPSPGVFGFITALPSTAQRSRYLDLDVRLAMVEHCAGLAEDLTRPESNRSEGAEGVMLLSDTIPDDVRRGLFDRMLVLARTDVPPTAVDIQFSGGRHLLSDFRADLGHGELHRDALQAAAALALDEEQAALVAARALSWLGREDKDIYAAVRALAILKSDLFTVDLGLLTAHPYRFVRQLAASFAARNAQPGADALRALRSDPDPSVRVSVGYARLRLAGDAPDLALELVETLRDDPHWSVRKLARDSAPSPSSDAGSTTSQT
jgi:hypothetical protein